MNRARLFFVISILCFTSCSSNSQPATSGGTLIVYLSRTSNTKAIAEIIHRHVGGRLVAIELERPYPENYQATVALVSKENEASTLPLLKTRIEHMEDYDTVFVGFPTWGMQLPPPMKAFLREHNMKGKTVIPFNTNAGYGPGSSFLTVKSLCPDSKVLKGFEMKGGVERDGEYFAIKDREAVKAEAKVKTWLRELQVIEDTQIQQLNHEKASEHF